MKNTLLYKDLARYYDLIYSFKSYKKEADKVKKLISKYKINKGKELLDVACGTGKHLKYFKDRFSCTGTDLNEGMLEIAKESFPGIKFIKSDMINLKIDKKI